MMNMLMKSHDIEFDIFFSFSVESKDEPISTLSKIDQIYSEASKSDEGLSDKDTIDDQNFKIITNDPIVSTLCVCRLCGIEAKTKG